MTVSRHRRRMSTTRAVIASLIGLGLALIMGVAGAVAIYNTKDGQVQGDDTPEVQFPNTPTGALAVLDGEGELASLAVLAVRPASDDDDTGIGGTIVPVPVTADASGGTGPERLPLDETVSLFGPQSLAEELQALLGVSIDATTTLNERELARTLAALGPLEVNVPTAVAAADGSLLADAGVQTIEPEIAAAILAARHVESGAEDYDVDVAVWSAIADAIGPGVDSPLAFPVGDPDRLALAETVGQLAAGSVSVQTLRFETVASVDLNPRGVDALALDRVDVTVLFGHVAPGRVAAPYAGYTFRVVSAFTDDQLSGSASRLDVAYTAVKTLLRSESNVRSVDTSPDEAPAPTVIEVASEALIPAAESMTDMFGPVEARVARTQIAGIDMVVTLGTDYLATLDASAAGETSTPAGDTVDGSTSASEGADTMAEGTS